MRYELRFRGGPDADDVQETVDADSIAEANRIGKARAEHWTARDGCGWCLVSVEPESFTLRNDPPRKPPTRPDNYPTRQRELFSGLDCLPGQLDLFEDEP